MSDCSRIPFKLWAYSRPPDRARFISERKPFKSCLNPVSDLFAPSSSHDNLVLNAPTSLLDIISPAFIKEKTTLTDVVSRDGWIPPYLPNLTQVDFFLL